MILEPWTPDKYGEICGWWAAHKYPIIPERWLSPFGLIARSGSGDGLAACWLYFTGTPVAFIENLVSNPKANKAIVSKAIDAVIDGCTDMARRSGCDVLLATTDLSAVVQRTARIGFKSQRVWFLTKILR